MDSKITQGEVCVMLGQKEIVLRPTPRAALQISRTYGGMAKARQAIVDENIDAIAFVLRVGANMADRDAKGLDERVFRNGIDADLLVPIIKFIGICGSGGRMPDDGDEDVGTHPAEGNG
jgi:hypothetical protein